MPSLSWHIRQDKDEGVNRLKKEVTLSPEFIALWDRIKPRTTYRVEFETDVLVRRSGEEVARGEVVARLVNPDELEIRLFVPLRYVRAIRPGDVVNVTAERRAFTAAVSSIVPAGDERTQSFEVLVKAPSVDGLLAPGNTVEVELPLGEPQRRIAVPRDALVIRAEGLYVYRVNGELRAERIEVKAGVADGEWIAVEGKLTDGDQVIVRGAELLRGNEKVQVVGIFEEQARSTVAVRP